MYEHQGIGDLLFVALYGAVTMMALLAGVYLLAARSNVFSREVTPPRLLRRWTAAFMAAVAASHVWWAVPVATWAGAGKAVRDVMCTALDLMTLAPLMMAWLLRLLQDRCRAVWPWVVAHVPAVVLAIVAVVRGDAGLLSAGGGAMELMLMYQAAVILVFVAYYVLALRHYARWLRDNFADLEHKEVWQSLALLLAVVAVYAAYTTNGGSLFREFLSQWLSVVIIAFVVWRTESLQALSARGEVVDENGIKVVMERTSH